MGFVGLAVGLAGLAGLSAGVWTSSRIFISTRTLMSIHDASKLDLKLTNSLSRNVVE